MKFVKKWYFKPFICVLIVFLCCICCFVPTFANSDYGENFGLINGVEYERLNYFDSDYSIIETDAGNKGLFVGQDTLGLNDSWNDYLYVDYASDVSSSTSSSSTSSSSTSSSSTSIIGTWVLNETIDVFNSSETIDFSNINITYQNEENYFIRFGMGNNMYKRIYLSRPSVFNLCKANDNGEVEELYAFYSTDSTSSRSGSIYHIASYTSELDASESNRTFTITEFNDNPGLLNWLMYNATYQPSEPQIAKNDFLIARQISINDNVSDYGNSVSYVSSFNYDRSAMGNINKITTFIEDIIIPYKYLTDTYRYLIPYYMGDIQGSDAPLLNCKYFFSMSYYYPNNRSEDIMLQCHVSYNSYSEGHLSKVYLLPLSDTITNILNEKGYKYDDNTLIRLQNVVVEFEVPTNANIMYYYSIMTREFGDNFRNLNHSYYQISNVSSFGSSLLLGVQNFLQFEILPGLSLFTLLMFALVIPMIIWILKIFLGG